MTDNLEIDLGVPSSTLRKKAAAFRSLAREMFPCDFRRNLLELAEDYDHQASGTERGNKPSD